MDLIAVADATMIFAPGRFLGISDEIDSRDMMIMPQLPGVASAKRTTLQASSMLYPSWWLTRFIENLA
jgi:hypothetical protein